MRKCIQGIMVSLSLLILVVMAFVAYYNYNLSDKFYVTLGSQLNIKTKLEVKTTKIQKDGVAKPTSIFQSNSQVVDIKLFGIFPIKSTRVEVVSPIKLIPAGTPFGVKLLTKGVLVVGISDIRTTKGTRNPARALGIEIGDSIESIGGRQVKTNEDIGAIVSASNGGPLSIVYYRNGNRKEGTISPACDIIDGVYKLGLWVRDSTAGIGTISFYDPQTSVFGALGHAVCDVDTGEILPISSGEIVEVTISGVEKGQNGVPGELKGTFSNSIPKGSVYVNNDTGVFGVLFSAPTQRPAIPIGLKQEIRNGEATILSTVEGTTPKEYKVMIEKISLNDGNITKNMIVKIVDPELLEITGGIVQGMSGSPIIQNGKIIGAVTHVLINDPTRGYAIFIENMYNNTKLVQEKMALQEAS